jgi:hypothetical protein
MIMQARVKAGWILALARKAGTLIGGFGKVETALRGEPVVALIHAAEAGERRRRQAGRRGPSPFRRRETPCYPLF